MQVVAEEKVRALQGKEGELQQLRQALRERDRLIEKINSAVLESQEKNKVSELQMWQFNFLTGIPYVFIKLVNSIFFFMIFWHLITVMLSLLKREREKTNWKS